MKNNDFLPPVPRNTRSIKRLDKASRDLLVVPLDSDNGRYLVESAGDSGRFYQVALQSGALAGHCTCTWAQYGGINCKHVMAALRARYEPNGSLSFWPNQDEARRQHRRIVLGEKLFATVRPHQRRNKRAA